jgi:NTE family protein
MKRIGVALGGGAAKGFAHIGVLKELRAIGIAPPIVAGTSIGALVGGWYAALGSTDGIERAARETPWRELLGLRDIAPRRVGAFFHLSRFAAWLRKETNDPMIEDLPIRFAAVATDIRTGERVVLKTGRLVDAILASIAVPMFLPPVEHDGRLLVDGGLVEPVPFETARQLGAELVIGVDLSSDVLIEAGRKISLRGFWKPWQLFNIFYNATSVMERQLVELQRNPDDIVLTPRVGHISPMDFRRADEGIRAGIEEVRAWKHEILKRAEIPHEVGVLEQMFGLKGE